MRPSASTLRLLESAFALEDPTDAIAYHHTVFCQTALPYRRVKDDVRIWDCQNGFVRLSVEAGRALHPDADGQGNANWVNLPLPFGPKARLIQIYLDTAAVLSRKPVVELEDSMTAFVARLQGRSPNGRELAVFREQASALAGALFRFATVLRGTEPRRVSSKEGMIQIPGRGSRTHQVDAKIVTGFELWYPKDERQRVLFPSYVRLSDEYFETLVRHAVPLDPRAVVALQHNAMALDIYKWLAQRLHRVSAKRAAFLPWPMVQAQFGQGYGRLRAFRAVFLRTLQQVLTQYPAARVEGDGQGLMLYHSRPPVLPKGERVNAL